MKVIFLRRCLFTGVNCLGTNIHRIRVGRQSFPSGHTSAAVLLFSFLYFYLKGTLLIVVFEKVY